MNIDVILPDTNSEEYQLLFRNAGANCGPVTRGNLGPISCKGSQLVYIIITLLNTINNGNLNNIRPDQLMSLYDYITSDRLIRRFSLFNNPSKMYPEIIDTENVHSIFPPVSEKVETVIYTMGLVNKRPFEGYPMGVISHFFIIIKNVDTETLESHYSILSSYGSDYVQVSQYGTPLDIEYFLQVVNAFDSLEESEERNTIIHDFIKTYFLTGGKKTYLIDEKFSGKKRFRSFEPERGAEKEIRIYYELDKYKFYYFPTFVSMVKEKIDNYYTIGGNRRRKRRTKRRHIRKRRTNKRKYL